MEIIDGQRTLELEKLRKEKEEEKEKRSFPIQMKSPIPENPNES